MTEWEPRWSDPREEGPTRDRVAELLSRAFGLPTKRVLGQFDQAADEDRILGFWSYGELLGAVMVCEEKLVGRDGVESVVFLNGAALDPTARHSNNAMRFFKEIAVQAGKTDANAAFIYPVSQSLYRSMGFGLATTRIDMSAAISSLHQRSPAPDWRLGSWDELAEISLAARERCFCRGRILARSSGMMRSATWDCRGDNAQAYFYGTGDDTSGYAVVKIVGTRLELLDYALPDRSGFGALLAFVATFGSVCETLEWTEPLYGPVHRSIDLASIQLRGFSNSMARILRLEQVLSGLPVRVRDHGSVSFQTWDPLFPENCREVELAIVDGSTVLTQFAKISKRPKDAIPIHLLSSIIYNDGHFDPISHPYSVSQKNIEDIDLLRPKSFVYLTDRDLF